MGISNQASPTKNDTLVHFLLTENQSPLTRANVTSANELNRNLLSNKVSAIKMSSLLDKELIVQNKAVKFGPINVKSDKELKKIIHLFNRIIPLNPTFQNEARNKMILDKIQIDKSVLFSTINSLFLALSRTGSTPQKPIYLQANQVQKLPENQLSSSSSFRQSSSEILTSGTIPNWPLHIQCKTIEELEKADIKLSDLQPNNVLYIDELSLSKSVLERVNNLEQLKCGVIIKKVNLNDKEENSEINTRFFEIFSSSKIQVNELNMTINGSFVIKSAAFKELMKLEKNILKSFNSLRISSKDTLISETFLKDFFNWINNDEVYINEDMELLKREFLNLNVKKIRFSHMVCKAPKNAIQLSSEFCESIQSVKFEIKKNKAKDLPGAIEFIKNNPHIKKIDFSGCGISDKDLNSLCTDLKGCEFDELIFDNNDISDTGLKEIVENLKVKKLSLSSCKISGETAFEEGPLHSSWVEHLCLSSNEKLTQVDFLTGYFENLCLLDLSKTPIKNQEISLTELASRPGKSVKIALKETSMSSFSRQLYDLNTPLTTHYTCYSLKNLTFLTDEQRQKLTSISFAAVKGAQLDHAKVFEFLKDNPQIVNIKLENYQIDDKVVKQLCEAGLSGIQSLILDNNKITTSGLKMLLNSFSLESLSLSRNSITGNERRQTKTSFFGSKNETSETSSQTDSSEIKPSSLKRLNLSYNPLESLEILESLSALEDLNINTNSEKVKRKISFEQICLFLKNHTHTTSVHIEGHKIKDEHIINNVEKLSNISFEKFNISNNKITTTGFILLLNKLSVKVLEVKRNKIEGAIDKKQEVLPATNIEKLYISFNPLKNLEFIQAFGETSSLQFLDISSTDVDDSSKEWFHKLPTGNQTIEIEVDISLTKISSKTMKSLNEIPNLKVNSENLEISHYYDLHEETEAAPTNIPLNITTEAAPTNIPLNITIGTFNHLTPMVTGFNKTSIQFTNVSNPKYSKREEDEDELEKQPIKLSRRKNTVDLVDLEITDQEDGKVILDDEFKGRNIKGMTTDSDGNLIISFE